MRYMVKLLMTSRLIMMKSNSKYNWSGIIYVCIIQLLTFDLQNISDWSANERLSFLAFGAIFVFFGVPYYNIFLKFVKDAEYDFKQYFKTFVWTNIVFLIAYHFIIFDLFNMLDWETRDRAAFIVSYICIHIVVFIWYDIRMTNKKKIEE